MINKYNRTRFFFLFSFLICCSSAFSQLVIKKDRDPVTLVQEVLIGNGITVSQIVYSQNPLAIGFFDGTKSNIGLDSGIILSTGNVEDARGPNDREDMSSLNNQSGDPDLDILANGNTTYDAASIQFDFVPIDNTVKFRFVFASEEYYKFVSKGYNDVFGFYISGPGYSGSENIALVPGTNVPISIASINNTTNSNLLINNAGGASVQYNAFTTVIEITANVQACSTYRIKFAIADVKDMAYDSGIFLEASSFSSNNINDVEVAELTTLATEGCDSIEIKLNRVSPDVSNSITVNYTVSGTAQNVADYLSIPPTGSITIPAGQKSVSIKTFPIDDGITEGVEQIIFEVQNPGICREVKQVIAINDYHKLDITDVIEVICQDSGIIVKVRFTGGSQSYNLLFTWRDSLGNVKGTGESTKLYPDSTQWFYVEGYDNCPDGISDIDSILLSPLIYARIHAVGDTTICQGNTFQIPVTTDYTGTPQYFWKAIPAISATISDPTAANPIITVQASVKLVVTLLNTDVCPEEKSINITVPKLELTSQKYFVCSADSTELIAQGGDVYEWYTSYPSQPSAIISTSSILKVSPPADTSYYVIIRKGDCIDTLEAKVEVDVSPDADAGPDIIICGREQVQLAGIGSPTGDYLWSPKNGLNDPKSQNPIANPTKTTTYVLRAGNNFCFDVDSITIFVIDSAEADFTYDVDTCAKVVSITSQDPTDSTLWDFGDGFTTKEKNPIHKYTQGGTYEILHETNKNTPCSDSKRIVVSFGEIDADKRRIPQAFSPNGDGKNDVFTIFGGSSACVIKRMQIYNRWGQVIFDSNETNSFSWDGTYKGKRVESGAYIYYIEGNGFVEKDWLAVIY